MVATFVLVASSASIVGTGRTARAQSEQDLEGARKLFAEALRDEAAGHYDVACEKFTRVQQVRDTVNVRYRIGTCLEGQRRLASALRAYEGAIELGNNDPASADVVREASKKVAALERSAPRLTLVLPASRPKDLEVRIDDAVVSEEELERPLLVDPGSHSVSVLAGGEQVFETRVALPEAGELAVAVPLDATKAPSPARPPAAPADTPFSRSRLPWTLTVAAGGALTAASVGLLVARHGDIQALNRRCPDGRCPPTENPDDIHAIRERAQIEGPLGVALGVVGLGALGFGLYMLTRPDSSPTPRQGIQVTPVVSKGGGAWVVRGEF